jgi:hypothetical protein
MVIWEIGYICDEHAACVLKRVYHVQVDEARSSGGSPSLSRPPQRQPTHPNSSQLSVITTLSTLAHPQLQLLRLAHQLIWRLSLALLALEPGNPALVDFYTVHDPGARRVARQQLAQQEVPPAAHVIVVSEHSMRDDADPEINKEQILAT